MGSAFPKYAGLGCMKKVVKQTMESKPESWAPLFVYASNSYFEFLPCAYLMMNCNL